MAVRILNIKHIKRKHNTQVEGLGCEERAGLKAKNTFSTGARGVHFPEQFLSI
jgi:hypothetical protein